MREPVGGVTQHLDDVATLARVDRLGDVVPQTP
ncbi:hypothetical protein BOA8489_01307 [Boseongicola aestuarii]|uniref:Uncharacterized protein n=1 Tax=Boseongicola aestuarii TaxID=1470561 RepID=A0A238IYV2_9RHOB|nr:hypothetical protein BOA8489_01307 [Boseongicola aestuarii]